MFSPNPRLCFPPSVLLLLPGQVYTTDHGWTDKGFAYEGSSHVPLLVSWPRLLASGAVFNQLASTIDIRSVVVRVLHPLCCFKPCGERLP